MDLNEGDPTKIFFPRKIIAAELEDLVKYLAVQGSSDPNNMTSLSMTHSYVRNYEPPDIGKSLEIDDIQAKDHSQTIRGSVHNDKGSSVYFGLISEYDGISRKVYSGIDFHVTPGYELRELPRRDIELMKSLKKSVETYFLKCS